MKKNTGVALACAGLLGMASSSASATQANHLYDWTMTENGLTEHGVNVGEVIGFGTMTTGAIGPDDDGDSISDVYIIASITGTLYGEAISLTGSTTGYDLMSGDGAFIYDNETQNLPGYTNVFDTDSGVLFTVGPLGGSLGNIWANGDLVTYNYYISALGGGYSVMDTNVKFNVTDPTPVPEPASLALLGIGLAGLALIRRRRPGSPTSMI